jgi:diguanylate cyclase (GGDEF)-like protein
VASHSGVELSRHITDEVAGAAAASARAQSSRPLPDAEDSYGAWTAIRRQLQAALQRIGALLRRDSLLTEKITRLEQEVESARRFAFHDELTGLPNRRLLADRFHQLVTRGARHHKQVVLLFLDLDGFKGLNDALGHAGGDSVLEQVAARLVDCIRASDTACRYGGDEFVVLLPDFNSQAEAVATAEKIRARLAAPYAVGCRAITITTSIGMAIFPSDGCELNELIQAADRAMYSDKARGPAWPHVQPISTAIARQARHRF